MNRFGATCGSILRNPSLKNPESGRSEMRRPAGLTLDLAARGKAWTPTDKSSPFAAGCLIETTKEGTPAYREEASGRLFMSDIVASMHQVSFVKIGVGKMQPLNKFKGHEQTIDMMVLRTTEG